MAAEKARAAVRLGRTRTMEQDLALGFQQLANITLRALSPGVNDPTTAREAIVYLGRCCGICCCGTCRPWCSSTDVAADWSARTTSPTAIILTWSLTKLGKLWRTSPAWGWCCWMCSACWLRSCNPLRSVPSS